MDRRTRTVKFRQLLSLWLGSEHGIRVSPRPYMIRLSEQMEEGFEQGHLLGLPDVLLNASVEREFMVGDRVDRAKADAALGGKNLYFNVQLRGNRKDPGDSIVATDLTTLGRVLVKLKRLEELEAAS